jgi:hypothetical protein
MESRASRLEANQELFRAVNEQVAAASEGFVGHGANVLQDFFCECGDAGCTLRVSMTLAEYENLRRSPSRYVVTVRHRVGAGESIVHRTGRFWLLEHAD